MRKSETVFIKNNKEEVFQNVVANFTGGVRHDEMEGRAYLVAPMIMMVAGVVDNGINGALLYSAEELSKAAGVWNSKPVVVYHPRDTACDPDILTNRGIGRIMNTRFEDGKLKAEAWIEVGRANEVDERVMEAIKNNSMMEVSTGLYCEVDKTPGTFEGKDYTAIVHNIRPDHLAILPDQTGACSIEDGAGLLRLNSKKEELTIDITTMIDNERKYLVEHKKRTYKYIRNFISNELSHDDVRSLIWSVLDDISTDAFVEDVFDDFFIYVDDGIFWRQGYSTANDTLTLVGEREQVTKVTEFRKLDGTVLNFRIYRKEIQMDKKTIVEGLISNKTTHWAEADREVLMNMKQDVLEKMVPIKNEEKETPAKEVKTETKTENKEEKSEEVKNDKPQTVDEFLATAPKEIQETIQNSLKATNEQKDRLIELITKNEKNTFTKEVLKEKKLEELQAIANLACDAKEVEEAVTKNNFAGFGETVENDGPTQEPLAITNHDTTKEVKKEEAA